MIPSLLYDTVKREIFENDISDLGKRLFEEREKINKDFINSLLGRKIFKDIINEIFEETDKYKIEYLKQFLLNSYIRIDTNNQEKSEILEILKSLQPTQLQILRALVNPEDTVDKIIQKWRSQRHPSWALRDDLNDIFQLDMEFFNRSISKLESSGLITIDRGGLVQWATGVYVEENIDLAKNQMMRMCQKLVTDFGQKFVKFIIESHDSQR